MKDRERERKKERTAKEGRRKRGLAFDWRERDLALWQGGVEDIIIMIIIIGLHYYLVCRNLAKGGASLLLLRAGSQGVPRRRETSVSVRRPT